MKSRNRFIYMILVGSLVAVILNLILPFESESHKPILDFVISILITFLVWEGNVFIDSYFEKRFSWIQNSGKRIMAQFPVSMIYSVVAITIPMHLFGRFICKLPDVQEESMHIFSLIIGILVTIIILSIETGAEFFRRWKSSLLEVEKYKTAGVQAQLQNLKEQLNPHFLFNNLSVLSSLVYKDSDKANDFINRLSKVYRYVLDTQNTELILLETELNFINSYIFLLQIRFDKNLIFKIHNLSSKKHLFIPPLVLQMLVENCVKHNEISEEHPLIIEILSEEDKLQVSNNLQLRSNTEPPSNKGLNNIKQRFSFYTEQEIEVIKTENSFTVKIPLLNKV